MSGLNNTFASPTADARAGVVAHLATPAWVASFLDGLTVWSALLYLFLAAVVYDQGTWRRLIFVVLRRY